MNHLAWAAVVLCATSGMAAAQGFSGAELSVETFAFSGDGDLGYTSYSAGAEYAITRDFGLSADLSFYGFSALDSDGQNLTLHGIYNLSDTTSLGVFVGQDSFDTSDATIYGIEGGTEFMGGTVEGYLAQVDGDDSATLLALSGDYAITQSIAATGGVGIVDMDDTLTRAHLGAEYQMQGGPAFHAELGQIGLSDTDETYLSIGATVAIGATRGTTFGRRSLLEILPGY